MKPTPWDAFRNIAVAVAFDGHAEPLVKLAGRLAARTGKRLLLLHAVEPWQEGLLARNLTDAVERRASELAMGRLVELAALAPPGVEVESAVLVGRPTEVLPQAALARECCLLCVGVDAGGAKLLLRGMSTALTLMATGPVPTLVADAKSGVTLADGALRVLVADDLTERSEMAVECAAALAAALGETALHHVHVSPLGEDELREVLQAAAAAARTSLDPAQSAREVVDALRASQQAKLAERVSLQREYVEEAGGAYSWEVAEGGVREGLEAVVKEFAPDVLVFGRHESLAKRPFHFGRMPLRAMLAYGKPVIVVPGTGA